MAQLPIVIHSNGVWQPRSTYSRSYIYGGQGVTKSTVHVGLDTTLEQFRVVARETVGLANDQVFELKYPMVSGLPRHTAPLDVLDAEDWANFLRHARSQNSPASIYVSFD